MQPSIDHTGLGKGLFWLPLLLAASLPLAALVGAVHHLTQCCGGGPARPQASAAGQPETGLALPALFSPEIQHWTPQIQRWGVEYQIPAELIATVMQIESCGHPQVASAAGALGLFQVMPFHFAAGEQPLEPEVNAQRGLRYLARSLELAAGDRRLALAGYNGGHAVIGWPASRWPDETLRYVDWGTRILRDVERAVTPSPGLQAWMDAGGAALCRRAAGFLGLS